MKLARVACAVLCALALGGPMCAEETAYSVGHDIAWRNIGPGGGGWIEALAWDPEEPGRLLLGCDVGGFYLSPDGGLSWSIHNEGLDDYFVESIAVDPGDRRTILLGREGGIAKSTDGGETWRPIREGFPPAERYSFAAPIGAVCFDPSRPGVAYAGVGRPRWASGGAGQIYRSADRGESWQLATAEGVLPADALVYDLEVAPDGSYVLAATDRGLYRSDDDGASWAPSGEGLGHPGTREVAIAPSEPRVVYCTLTTTARDDRPFDGGVYRSEDAGRTWVRRSEGLADRVGGSGEPEPMTSNYDQLVVDPRDAETAYVGDWAWVTAGVSKTTDGGRSWTKVTDHWSAARNMDYGWISQWGPSVTCLALSPTDPDALAFGTSGHVFVTSDAGRTWEQRYCSQPAEGRFAGSGLEVTCLFDVLPDPHRPERLYGCYYDIGLLISDDAGATFRRSASGMASDGNCFTVVPDPDDAARLWATTGQWASNVGDVCRSLDGGATWSVVGKPESGLPVGSVRCLVLDPTSLPGSRRLFATSNGNGIFRSDDGGDSWRPLNAGLPEEAAKQPCRLLMDPRDARHLRLALGGNPKSGGGIYESVDGGETWLPLSGESDLCDLIDFEADPRDFDRLYVCQRERYDRSYEPPRMFPGGLFGSTDGGRSWVPLFGYHFASCVAVSPLDSDTLYLGLNDHPYHDANTTPGVLKSRDGGLTWTREIDGLTSTHVTALRLDPRDPTRLYVGTGGNGIFLGRDAEVAAREKDR